MGLKNLIIYLKTRRSSKNLNQEPPQTDKTEFREKLILEWTQGILGAHPNFLIYCNKAMRPTR